jgi:hypothetical protein
MHIEDLEANLTINPPADSRAKFEAVCHLCSWSFHRWTEEEARMFLRSHIIDAHLTPIGDRVFVAGTGPNTS